MSDSNFGTKSKNQPATPSTDKKKKKGLFGGLFGKKKGKDGSMTPGKNGTKKGKR